MSPIRLIIAAVVFHLAVTSAVYGLGRAALLPGMFDPNGIAASFAPDGMRDRAAVGQLSEVLKRGEIRNWLSAPYPFHFKLYSICFAVFGPLFGFTIVSAEPFNALCYVATLVLVFNMGQDLFNRRAGLIAAATVGIWPSFLLHTTQLLRDPLFITGMLALILINVRVLLRNLSWSGALLYGVAGGLVAMILWLTRDNMGELVIAIAILGAGTLVLRQLAERRFLTTNMFAVMLLIVVAVSVSAIVPRFRDPLVPRRSTGEIDQVGPVTTLEAEQPVPRWNLAARIFRHRTAFIKRYPEATSSIDRDIELTNNADLIRYLPRAAVVGFFAPFPNMWFTSGGQVGSAGRLLSGLETLVMYVVEALALVALWRGRRRLSVWFLVAVVVMGIVALGLVVVNVGTLYRLRFIFLILMIVLAAEGMAQLFDWCRTARVVGIPQRGQTDLPAS